jgi:hypothetical protein
MKNRNIILPAILSLLGCGLSCTALAAGPPVDFNVNVLNTTTNPVPVTGIVTAADNPLNAGQQSVVFFIAANANTAGTSIGPIPAGKTFVLETVSYQMPLPGVKQISVSVTGPDISDTGHSAVGYQLVVPPNAPTSGFAGSQALRVYAQQGSTIDIGLGLDPAPTSSTVVQMSFSGYFVSAP